MGRHFPSVYSCSSAGRNKQVVVSDLDGTLLRSSNAFPYFMLMAWEVSAGLPRFTALLLLSPVAWLLYTLVSESAAIKLLIWVTFVNAKMSNIESAAQTVLPKFYVRDVHPEAWRVVSSFGRRYLLTASPRVMVEPFAKRYLGVDEVLGTELAINPSSKRATGFVRSPGVLVGYHKEAALRKQFGDHPPDVGLGDRESDYPFLAACKEGYLVDPSLKTRAMPPNKLSQPLIFHDGRLMAKPTPFLALLILLWLPLGIVLAVLRLLACFLVPMSISCDVLKCLGVRLIVNGCPPSCRKSKVSENGVFLVCTHRTLLDPIILSAALRRPMAAITFSSSCVSKAISPIPMVQLSRDRERDANLIKNLLKKGNLVVCPEGTPCSEPYLSQLRALFADFADCLVPVATKCHVSMFNAPTARGWKGLDSFYFFMNPHPCYEVIFLEQLPLSLTCASGKSAFEVANYVQNLLTSSTLSFQSINFTPSKTSTEL